MPDAGLQGAVGVEEFVPQDLAVFRIDVALPELLDQHPHDAAGERDGRFLLLVDGVGVGRRGVRGVLCSLDRFRGWFRGRCFGFFRLGFRVRLVARRGFGLRRLGRFGLRRGRFSVRRDLFDLADCLFEPGQLGLAGEEVPDDVRALLVDDRLEVPRAVVDEADVRFGPEGVELVLGVVPDPVDRHVLLVGFEVALEDDRPVLDRPVLGPVVQVEPDVVHRDAFGHRVHDLNPGDVSAVRRQLENDRHGLELLGIDRFPHRYIVARNGDGVVAHGCTSEARPI